MAENKATANGGENGYLIVTVSEANRAVPLPQALVTVKGADKANSGVIVALVTDKDGRTAKVALPAPARVDSMTPSTLRPYSSYNIEVDLEGFYSQSNLNVPIFAGVTSLQNADLIPLPTEENLYPGGNTRFFEGENEYLQEKSDDT